MLRDLSGSAPYYEEVLRARNRARSILFRCGIEARDHDDVIHETFIKAWKYWNPDILPFVPWFFVCLKRNTPKYRHPTMFVALHDETVSSALYEEQTYNPDILVPECILNDQRMIDVLEAIDILPWHSRQVITLLYFEELSYPEIAMTLKVKKVTLRGWLHRGLLKVIEILAERGKLH